jgi:hypothetical protein
MVKALFDTNILIDYLNGVDGRSDPGVPGQLSHDLHGCGDSRDGYPATADASPDTAGRDHLGDRDHLRTSAGDTQSARFPRR